MLPRNSGSLIQLQKPCTDRVPNHKREGAGDHHQLVQLFKYLHVILLLSRATAGLLVLSSYQLPFLLFLLTWKVFTIWKPNQLFPSFLACLDSYAGVWLYTDCRMNLVPKALICLTPIPISFSHLYKFLPPFRRGCK